MGADRPGRPRIDRWLWAARFYKTRSLAARAVEGGKVKLNGERVKPGKEVKSGDELELRSGELQWLIEVRAVAPPRRRCCMPRARKAGRGAST